MSAIDVPRDRSRARTTAVWWLALSAVAIAMFAPRPYLTSSLSSLGNDNGGLASDYDGRPVPILIAFYLHITFAGVALLLSPIQLSARVRARAAGLHRAVGRITLACIGVAGVAAAVLAPVNHAGPVGIAGFGLLAVLWVAFAVAALRAIRRGDVPTHRRWAIRTFALTYAAVTLRLWVGVLIAIQTAVTDVDPDLAFDRAYYLAPFLCWVPNLIVAQWLLTRPPMAPARPPAAV